LGSRMFFSYQQLSPPAELCTEFCTAHGEPDVKLGRHAR
jgi:hypothetical protein